MDEVRIEHEDGANQAQVCFLCYLSPAMRLTIEQTRDELNTAIHDIELAVERGKANAQVTEGGVDTVGLEVVVKSVAAEASSASSEGGILKQIKEFNAFLERAALALESRA
jgi:hypothetical protein